MSRIKELRKASGYSQQKLAQILNVHQTAISQWETERTNPDIDIASQLSDLFDVSLDYLLGRTEKQSSYDSSLYERIQKLIDESGKSYSELEKITGVAKSSLQRYASGVTVKVPLDVIEKLENAFGVPRGYIMGWDTADNPTFCNPNLYVNIKTLRKNANMTQEELARLTGYTDRSSIARIERGEIDLSQSKIMQFARVLGTTPAALMGWGDQSESRICRASTAERLCEIMRTRSLRQIDIVKLCEPYARNYKTKIGRNDICQYVSGKVTPSRTKINILSQALGVSEVWLMGYGNEKPSAECEGLNDNIVVLRRRGGGVTSKKLTDAQIDALQAVIDQFSEC